MYLSYSYDQMELGVMAVYLGQEYIFFLFYATIWLMWYSCLVPNTGCSFDTMTMEPCTDHGKHFLFYVTLPSGGQYQFFGVFCNHWIFARNIQWEYSFWKGGRAGIKKHVYFENLPCNPMVSEGRRGGKGRAGRRYPLQTGLCRTASVEGSGVPVIHCCGGQPPLHCPQTWEWYWNHVKACSCSWRGSRGQHSPVFRVRV